MKAWSVNTNTKEVNGNPNAYKYMLRQNKAAAFYDRASEIDQIDRGDLVFLYHNKNRIIAVGTVVTPFEGHDFKKIEEVEHWVDVNWLWKADFDSKFEPINPIDRKSLGITFTAGTVNNVTEQINYRELFVQIASRQSF